MIRRNLFVLLLVALAIQIPFAIEVRAADPTLKGIGPDTISVGDPDFTIRINGENFNAESVVLLDGVELVTTFLQKKRLHALVPASVSAAAGTHTVAVRNADGATTGTQALSVVAPDTQVVIERINPDTLGVITTGQQGEFRVTGEGFNDKSQCFVYGRRLTTSLREKGTLSVIVPSEFISVPGIMPFQVKRDGGGLSRMFTVPVFDRTASIFAVDPTNVDAGSEAFTLKITGTGFNQGAIVLIGDTALTPTDIKAQQIKVMVPASVVANASQLVIYVVQSTGLSNAIIFRVTPADDSPLIYNINPIEIQAGAGAADVEVDGANFTEKSKVLVNGEEQKTTFGGRTSVTFKLSESQTDTAGVTYTIQVQNNDGTVSNVATLEIVPAALVSTLSGLKLDGFVDGGPDEAKFRRPSRMSLGPDGLIYVADQLNNAIRRLNPATGFVETISGDGLPGYVDSGDSTAEDFTEPRFNSPLGIAVNKDGIIFVADYGNEVIRRLTPSGSGYTVDTVAGANEPIDDKDTRKELHSTRRGLSGFANGAGETARFRGVDGMALSSEGLLIVADAQNHYIRSIDTSDADFTVATVSGIGVSGFNDGTALRARYTTPTDVALNPDETILYVADFGNNRVRAVDLATGVVSTLSGSGFPGSMSGNKLVAQFNGPIGVQVGQDGTVYVADNTSDIIRRVTPDGVATTLAGNPANTKFKDGIGPVAHFKNPRGLLLDPALGVLYVADQSHQRLRMITPE